MFAGGRGPLELRQALPRGGAGSSLDRAIFCLSWRAEPTILRGPMFLMLSKHPRKQNRTKTKRFRAKLKAKNQARRARIYCRAK